MSEKTIININVADDKPLSPGEIAYERKICEALARGVKPHQVMQKATYFTMNRAYLRSLERGETKRVAEQDASHAGGALAGAFFAVIFTLLFVGFLGWAYDLAETAKTINTIIAICIWLTVFALGFGWTRRKIAALYRRLRKKKA